MESATALAKGRGKRLRRSAGLVLAYPLQTALLKVLFRAMGKSGK